ncbi:MSHA biogenesis protein, MshQ, partial [mine drainage metagenome]
PATTSASTCVPDPITITALDSQGQPLTTYTDTIALSTSSGHGNWSIDQGQGILTPGPADSGTADYTFSSADQGTVILYLADTHADDLTITATDLVAGVTGTSSAIAFRDNAFVFTPENPPADGPDVVVAGRPETIGVAMIDRDPTTGTLWTRARL